MHTAFLTITNKQLHAFTSFITQGCEWHRCRIRQRPGFRRSLAKS